MPNLPMVRSHLAERIRENGAQFSAQVLEIMSAASNVVPGSDRQSGDGDVATAAYAASQLKSDDAKKAAADQLKGIGYAYGTYTLFAPRSLNAIYVQMTADKENGFPAL
jgi:hypothetical protein